jgi:hypothetical protein
LKNWTRTRRRNWRRSSFTDENFLIFDRNSLGFRWEAEAFSLEKPCFENLHRAPFLRFAECSSCGY